MHFSDTGEDIQNASKKWMMSIYNWNLTLSQLVIFFEGRPGGSGDGDSDSALNL